MREGDQFLVTRLDRLARSVKDLSDLTKHMEEKKVDLVVLDQAIDTSTPTGRLLFHMLAAIGEFERDLIRERSAEGIARAKANGVRFGTRPKLDAAEIKSLRAEFVLHDVDRNDLARRYGISRTTLYRLCDGAKTDGHVERDRHR